MNNTDNKKNKYNYEEIYEILTNFIDYNQDCNYDIPELLYYLKFNHNVDCLGDFKNIGQEFIEVLDDDDMKEEDYYRLVFTDITEENQNVLNKLDKAIKRYLKTGFIPDPYIECEKKKTLKLKKDK